MMVWNFKILWLSFCSVIICGSGIADNKSVEKIWQLANAIKAIRPNLSEQKYLQYGSFIFHAALRYNVDPQLLIAIAQQESHFREGLPEGNAGEHGICQVLKGWRHDLKFQAEFGYVTVRDFDNSRNSFLYAAWLLSKIKTQKHSGKLPYWSYYNSKRFVHRLNYFVRVNRYLVALKKHNDRQKFRVLASLPPENLLTVQKRVSAGNRTENKESKWISAALRSLMKKNKTRALSLTASEFGVRPNALISAID